MTDTEITVEEEDQESRSRRKVWIWAGSVAVMFVLLGVVFASRFGEDPRVIDSPLIGEPITNLQLEYLDGSGTLEFDELRGSVVVVNFWASWCIPCRTEHGHLTSVQTAYNDDGVQFVGVVFQDTDEAAEDFLAQLGRGEGYLYVSDPGSRAAVEFGVFGVPETFFVDQNGVIVDKHIGPVDSARLVSAIEEILTSGS